MRKSIRFALLASAALTTLAFASSAFASFAPKLVISSSTAASAGPTRLGVLVANADDPTAKVSIYVPSAYQVGAPAAGTKLGDVTATASAADLGGAVLPLTGELDAIAPTATTNGAAAACGVTPAQTWDLHLTAAGQVLDIPLFVVASSAPEVAVGFQTKLVVCLPPPDVPAGTPGRAVFGAKLLSATFTSSAVTEPAAKGDYRWTSLWTPYNPGKGTVNAAGSVEVQAVRHVPVALGLTVTKKKISTVKHHKVHGKLRKYIVVSTLVKFSSAVTANGAAPASVVVTTTVGGKAAGGASGSFKLLSGKSATVVSTAVVDNDTGNVPTGQPANAAADLFYHDLGANSCVPTPIFQGLPCTSVSLGGEMLKATASVKGYK